MLKLTSTKRALAASIAFLTLASASIAQEKKIEVLHMWTSGGEAAAAGVLKDAMAAKGYTWTDTPAIGTEALNQVLRSRVASQTAPGAVDLHSQEIGPWVTEGALTDLSSLATKGNWDNVMSKAIIPYVKRDGAYYAVPTEMHRANWLWYNKKVFDKLGLQPPKTLDEFKAVAEKLRAAGVIPLAIGGQNWQEATLFESILVAIAGPDFYRKAIMEQDEAALSSDTMVKVFDEFRSMNKYTDPNFPGRDWNIATQMVMSGTAGMQVLGDYAKGEFDNAKLKVNVDFGCAPAPGTAGTYLSVVDAFGFFLNSNESVKQAQLQLAEVIMDPEVQLAFSIKKGSIPARTDVKVDKLDACGQAAYKDRGEAEAAGKIFPSVAHFEAWPAAKSGVFMDVISTFFEKPSMSSKDAVAQLVSGLKSASE